MTHPPEICDYEGSDYRTRFWQEQGRDYEDQVERLALRRLLAPHGRALIDIGAGFGRLADEYQGYEKVVLFDFSRSLLREAQDRYAADPRFIFVAGSWYQMPFVDGLFDALVQIRTIHHAADVPGLFRELKRITMPGGSYILEFASKHHLKAILRYWSGRQKWSPFSWVPVEFVELNFDFHPRWIEQQLKDARFNPGRVLTVSHFRSQSIKRILSTRLLVRLDNFLQPTGRWWQLTPSVFVASKIPVQGQAAPTGAFFACPVCRTPLGNVVDGLLQCPAESCRRGWRFDDGLYDFKEEIH